MCNLPQMQEEKKKRNLPFAWPRFFNSKNKSLSFIPYPFCKFSSHFSLSFVLFYFSRAWKLLLFCTINSKYLMENSLSLIDLSLLIAVRIEHDLNVYASPKLISVIIIKTTIRFIKTHNWLNFCFSFVWFQNSMIKWNSWILSIGIDLENFLRRLILSIEISIRSRSENDSHPRKLCLVAT